MDKSETSSEGGKETQKRVEIVRSDVMFGNIRVRCPDDGTEHEVAVDSITFRCPLDNQEYLVG